MSREVIALCIVGVAMLTVAGAVIGLMNASSKFPITLTGALLMCVGFDVAILYMIGIAAFMAKWIGGSR